MTASIESIAQGIDRPSAAFFHPGTMLISPHDGAVDHGIFVVGIAREMLKQLLPDTGFGPAAKTPMNAVPVIKPFRQVTLGDIGPMLAEYCIDKPPIIRPGYPDRS